MSNDTDATTQASQPTRSNGNETNGALTLGSRNLRTTLNYAALVFLVLLALVSAVQAYTAIGGMINRLISPEYREFFRAAFNLTVLLLCVGGISLQLKRIS
jgi:hypothetical protein